MVKEVIKKIVKRVVDWIRTFLVRKFHLRNDDIAYYIAILAGLILLVITITGFVEITDSLAEDELGWYDEVVSEYIIGFRSPAITSFFLTVTHFGDRIVYIFIIAALAVFFWIRYKNRRFTIQTVFVLVIASLSNIAIKRVINRERPDLDGRLTEVNSLSYPSGHSMSAMAFYGLLIYFCIRYKLPRALRWVLIIMLTLIILMVGTSRIYLGVHYPSDVAAGYLGGLIWVSFAILIFNTLELWRKRRKEEPNAPPQEE